MPGPHSPNPGVGTNGPAPYPEPSSHEPQALDYPHDLGAAEPAFAPGPADDAALPPAAYPGVPPQVSYPKRRHKRLLIGIVLALALVSAMTAAIIYGVRTNGANTAGTFSEGPAKTAIQGYLNALENRDVDTIVRNALCGIHDGVRDKRSDQALAKLSSDAFRKQFSQVEVTSIDKIVYWSQYQAQVLFTMQVTPAAGGRHAVRCKASLSCFSSAVRSWCARTCCAPRGRTSVLSVERIPARAGAGGVGIVDGEALLLNSVDEIDRRAFHIRRAHPVHDQPDTTELRGLVTIQRPVVEEKVIAQSSAPPAEPRSAAPDRPVPPGPTATSPWRRPLRSGSRRGSWRSARSAPS